MAEFAEQLQAENPDEEEEVYATFDDIDQNGDGVVSREEWAEAGLNPDEFDSIDANGDGVIEREEFENYVL